MTSPNKNVCWGCRRAGHVLWDCPLKRKCPKCGKGLVKLMKVVNVEESMGKLFHSCTVQGCKYFEWDDVFKSKASGTTKAGKSHEIEELSHIFNTTARIADEKDVEVSLNATFRKGKGKVD